MDSIHGRKKNDPSSFYNKKEEQDRKDFELILEAYNFKGYDKGRRGIHMRLLHMGILINHKKISDCKTIEEQTVGEKYELIDKTLNSPRNVLTVSYLCESAGVSRSGFYSWKKKK